MCTFCHARFRQKDGLKRHLAALAGGRLDGGVPAGCGVVGRELLGVHGHMRERANNRLKGAAATSRDDVPTERSVLVARESRAHDETAASSVDNHEHDITWASWSSTQRPQ